MGPKLHCPLCSHLKRETKGTLKLRQTMEELACFCVGHVGGEQERKSCRGVKSPPPPPPPLPPSPPPHLTSLNLFVPDSLQAWMDDRALKREQMLMRVSCSGSLPPAHSHCSLFLSLSLSRHFDFHSFQSEESRQLPSPQADCSRGAEVAQVGDTR